MRRRDHERALRDKDKEILWLRGKVDDLEDRLMHATGRPWAIAPADVSVSDNGQVDEDDWVPDPSQLP